MSLFPKYMSYQDLHYLILKLLTKNYGLSNHKNGSRSKGFRTRGQSRYPLFFYSDFMYLDCDNPQMVKEMFPLFVSFNILPKKGRNIEENLLIEQICHWGSILYASPCMSWFLATFDTKKLHWESSIIFIQTCLIWYNMVNIFENLLIECF